MKIAIVGCGAMGSVYAGLFASAGHQVWAIDRWREHVDAMKKNGLRLEGKSGDRTIKVNARVVAATNRDLRAAVTAGTFREDLYFRVGAFVITVPPLRERREDIPLLVHDFVRRAAGRVQKDVHAVSAEAMTALMNYGWPGNVRELEHAIERAVIVARAETIRPRELPPEVAQNARPRMSDDSLDLREHERAMIERALERFGGNRKQAAEALNISTVTLWRKMKQYGLVFEGDGVSS